jgi:RsiW-degrading membrane proteinase PrsW (M82 family)
MTFDLILGLLLSLLLGVIPMAIYAGALTFFDPYEKEPPTLLIGVFLWGLIVAAGSAFILNTVFSIGVMILTNDELLTLGGTAVISAPLVEETVKGLAVFAVFLYFRHEFDSVMDGVIYGSMVGFGFAAAENVNYIASGFAQAGFEGLAFVAFIRIIAIGFLHATLTSFTGIGFAVARLNKGCLRWAAIPTGYVVAMGAHALHNFLASLGGLACLLGSVFDWIGFLGLFVFILFLGYHESRVLRQHLREEVTLGNLTETQYRSACSLGGQLLARFGAGNAQLNNLCGELAFKKYQLARLGHAEERDAQATIDKLRGEIAAANRGA